MLKMPSPQSKKEPKSGVAYTRWKPTDDCEEEETNKLNVGEGEGCSGFEESSITM